MEDILKYIDRIIEAQLSKDKDDFDKVIYEGKGVQVTRDELGLVVSNLISNINSQMLSTEEEVIDNFNVLVQSMLDSKIIDENTVKKMQELIYENKQKVEEDNE